MFGNVALDAVAGAVAAVVAGKLVAASCPIGPYGSNAVAWLDAAAVLLVDAAAIAYGSAGGAAAGVDAGGGDTT